MMVVHSTDISDYVHRANLPLDEAISPDWDNIVSLEDDSDLSFDQRFTFHRGPPGSLDSNKVAQALYGRLDFHDTNILDTNISRCLLPTIKYANTWYFGFLQDFAQADAGLDDDYGSSSVTCCRSVVTH